MIDSRISKVEAMEILDSRGNPTVAAVVTTAGGARGWSAVPSGASTGTHEALELRDGDKKRYGGKGVLKAVKNIEGKIAAAVGGQKATDQKAVDRLMLDLDGTEHKTKLGANAILAVSLATARAGAAVKRQPLYRYLRDKFWPKERGWRLPAPMMNVLNGGKHAPGSVDLQEFMIFPTGARTFAQGLRWGVEVYQTLKKILLSRGMPVGVGDEGGFMPKFKTHEQILKLMVEAIGKAGYQAGRQVALALDPAASEVYEGGRYNLKTEGKKYTSGEMVKLYEKWVKAYPIVSIEDGLAEDDWEGFGLMTRMLGGKIQIVGDDLYVTNRERFARGIAQKCSNAILVKLNQIGTLWETAAVIDQARQAGMAAVVSHRSGETEDDFIADLTVAANSGQIKTGAPCRSERTVKYNRLLQIEKELGGEGKYGVMIKSQSDDKS